MKKNCLQCNIEIIKPVNESVKCWTTRHKFCSKVCQYSSMKGKTVHDNSGRKLTDEHKKKISDSHKGEKAYQWKGGITPEHHNARNSPEYAEWRTAVYKRDNWTCQDCGIKCQKGNIVAHHLVSFVERVDLRHVVENGQVLCRPCHARVHSEERNFARSIAKSKVFHQVTVA